MKRSSYRSRSLESDFFFVCAHILMAPSTSLICYPIITSVFGWMVGCCHILEGNVTPHIFYTAVAMCLFTILRSDQSELLPTLKHRK